MPDLKTGYLLRILESHQTVFTTRREETVSKTTVMYMSSLTPYWRGPAEIPGIGWRALVLKRTERGFDLQRVPYICPSCTLLILTAYLLKAATAKHSESKCQYQYFSYSSSFECHLFQFQCPLTAVLRITTWIYITL